MSCISKTLKFIVWLLVLPVLLVISLIGLVVWLILKVCCCIRCVVTGQSLEVASNLLQRFSLLLRAGPLVRLLWLQAMCLRN